MCRWVTGSSQNVRLRNGYSHKTSGTPRMGPWASKKNPRLTGLKVSSFNSPSSSRKPPRSGYNTNMQSPTPSVHIGFPKAGRKASTSQAGHPVITKQRSLLSQSLLSAEADRDARRCSRKLEQATEELSESEESAHDAEEEEMPCCNGALQIPKRYRARKTGFDIALC